MIGIGPMIGVGAQSSGAQGGFGGFTPADLPGLQLWLDGFDPATITITGSGVSQWADKSGLGNHAVNGNNAERPTYPANDGVQFGAGKSLILPAAIRTVLSGVDFTLFHDFTLDDEAPTQGIGSGYNNTFGNVGPLYFLSVLFWNYYNGTSLTSENVGAATTGRKQLTTNFDGTLFQGRRNGVQLVSRNNAAALVVNSARVGAYGTGDNALRGRMHRTLLYSPALSADDILKVEAYLAP